MNKQEIKLKIQKLVNHYNSGNYPYVIQESGLLLKKLPNNIFLMNLIGSSFQRIGQLEKSKRIFKDIISLDNSNTAAYNNLGNTHKLLKEYDLAEKSYNQALKIDPNFSNCLQNFANLKFDLNDYEGAIKLYKKAISKNPKSFLTYYNLGLVYQSLGEFDQAESYLKKVTEINPNFTNADKIISRFKKYEKVNEHVVDMEKRLKSLNLSDFNKSNILFALGKAYEDIKNFEKSFKYLEDANILQKKFTKYDFKNDKIIFENIKNNFSDLQFKDTNKKISDRTYIFIVGLPRSGTSLIEQILSSHSLVYGAGELPYLPDAIKNEFFKNNNEPHNTTAQEKVADIFDKNVNKFNFSEKYLTDKNPLNFLWIGYIKLIFPNAKIIHIRRDIKDNYFSLYKNIFDGNMNWCYNKSDLLNYCLNYQKIIEFWNQKIPNFILNIQYEDVVSNTESEIKKLLKFCDLAWENKCLEFYKTKRAIKTVSSAQARKPIYKSSIKSYKNYESFLEEYLNKLK